ncbi:U-box domain-containing protein 10 [Linum perenne]
MAGGGNGPVLDHATPTAGLLLQLVRDIMVGGGNGCSSLPSPSSSSLFRKDCMDLVRRISLLTHFLEEIVDSVGESGLLDDPSRSWGSRSWCSALLAALHAAKRLLTVASTSKSSSHSDGAYCKIALQFRSVTCKLEKALGEIPFSQFNISEEVQEQVALVRSQLQRASERYRFVNADTTSSASAQQPILQNNRLNRSWKIEDVGCVNHDAVERPDTVVTEGCDADKAHGEISEAAAEGKVDSGRKSLEDLKKADAPTIPDDFLCPISLELMRDPVIVATGQTYERSFIQRWIDAGNMTCPKTQQKLQHSTLTPNYVLRSLIAQWCMKHNTEDVSIHENAVTSILNLSIHENNKGLIMLAGAIPSIVQVLRAGSVEAKENAAATLFSLSLGDENKIIIGASGAIPALVELLENGSTRGKKDAASALFNLCIYQGNKGRAVRAGIIAALLRMLTDSRSVMVDEALTILSVLSSNQEAKAAIVKASTIPILIDVLRTGEARSKENAASILLSLCKRDPENLGCISRLGAVIPLTELTKSGTERAKRKAGSLLDHIRKQMHPHHRHHQ